MAESINALAAQIAAPSEDTLSAALRMGTITAVEAVSPFRVQTDATSTAWLTRDRGATLNVGDRVWMLKQRSVWLVGGRLNGGSGSPVGTVVTYAGASAPDGWLACNGAAVSRTTYAALYAVLGTTYGVGDGSTTFNVPNLVDRTVVGAGGTYTRGQTGGAATVALTTAQLPAHDHGSAGAHIHTVPSYTVGVRATGTLNTQTAAVGGTTDTSSAGAHTHASVGSGTAHENMPPFQALSVIIRAV